MVLPFAHLTGLRNLLAVTCIGATFVIFGLKPLAELPGKFAIAAVFVWAVISLCWSADRTASWAHLKDDLALGFLAYAAAFTLFQNSDSATRVLKTFPIAVAALSLVCCFALLPSYVFASWIPVRYDLALDRPMPIWYPGMGDASMFFALCIAPLLLLGSSLGNRRWLAAVAGILLFTGAMVIRNRAIALILPASLGFYYFARATFVASRLDRPKIHLPRLVTTLSGLLVTLLVAAAVGEIICHQRYALSGQSSPPWGKALTLVLEEDPRPKIWREYLSLGMSHPLTGVGFGRTVPATAYHTKTDPTLLAADTAAPTHAHNLFIDIWLQLGYVGLGLSLWVVADLVRCVMRFARQDSSCTLIAASFFTLVFVTGMRCATDDLLTYGLGSAFWILSGAMLGWQTRISRKFPSGYDDTSDELDTKMNTLR